MGRLDLVAFGITCAAMLVFELLGERGYLESFLAFVVVGMIVRGALYLVTHK